MVGCPVFVMRSPEQRNYAAMRRAVFCSLSGSHASRQRNCALNLSQFIFNTHKSLSDHEQRGELQ